MKLDKYIEDTNEIKYKKLEASIFWNVISSNVSKNTINY